MSDQRGGGSRNGGADDGKRGGVQRGDGQGGDGKQGGQGRQKQGGGGGGRQGKGQQGRAQGKAPQGQGKRAARDRLAADRARQQQAKGRKRRSSGILIVVIVLLVVAGIAFYAWQKSNDEGPSNAALPSSVRESGGGVVLGDGPVDVTLWEDFQCPVCKDFEAQNGEMLRQRVEDGDITLTIHPVSFLDAKLDNDSSVLAANAFGCSTDAGEKQALDYHLTIYQNQPPENPGTAAWSTDDLIGWGNDVGIDSDEWQSCVNDTQYEEWVSQVQTSMSDEGITGTPTVFLDGEQFDTTTSLDAAIDQALKSDQ